mgnify:FL=1
MKLRTVVLGGLLAIVACWQPGLAAELHVPGQYSTIQAAIDAAEAGDVVQIAPGTYRGPGNRNIDLKGKNITVRGDGTAAEVVIDCESLGRGFVFRSNETRQCVLENVTVMRGHAINGGGVYCWGGASPTIRRCVVAFNQPNGIACEYFASPLIEETAIQNNTPVWTSAVPGGTASWGGGISATDSEVQMIRCELLNNVGSSGGACVFIGGTAKLLGCRIAGNRGLGAIRELGSGAFSGFGNHLLLVNCTFNAMQSSGIVVDSSLVEISNSIVWGSGFEFEVYGSGQILARHSNIRGGWPGEGNIDQNPMFVRDPDDGGDGFGDDPSTLNMDESANDDLGDIVLQPGSPCVDAGLNELLPPGLTTDLVGRSRIIGDVVDMGAIEFDPRPSPDFDGDGDVDQDDFGVFQACSGGAGIAPSVGCEAADLDADGDVDQSDFGVFQRALTNSQL